MGEDERMESAWIWICLIIAVGVASATSGYLEYQIMRLRRETRIGLKEVSQVRILPESVKVLVIPENNPTGKHTGLNGYVIHCDAVLVQADSTYVSSCTFLSKDYKEAAIESKRYPKITGACKKVKA